jgi:hypothetical protein
LHRQKRRPGHEVLQWYPPAHPASDIACSCKALSRQAIGNFACRDGCSKIIGLRKALFAF